MWIVFWIVMALVVAVVASGKGRSGVGWFFYGLLLWPVALAHICVSRRREERGPAISASPASPAPTPLADVATPRALGEPGAGCEWVRVSKLALPVRGLTKDNPDGTPRQELIAELQPGDALAIVPEPENTFDRHALRFMTIDESGCPRACVGYVPAERAEEFAKRQAAGTGLQAIVERVERVDGAPPFLAPRVRFELWDTRPIAAPTVAVSPNRDFALPELPDLPPPPVKSKILPGVVGIALLIAALFVMVRLNAPADSLPPRAATPVAPPVPGPPIRVLAEASLIAGPFTQAGGRGLTRGEIAELQATLNRIGLDVGAADGVAGPRTRAALREIERQAGWGPAEAPVAAHLEWARMRAR
jgi:hypothetical protein